MRTIRLFIVVVTLILTICGFAGFIGNPVVVKPQELKSWIDYLASDEMRGRANGSPEMKLAAAWLSERFKEFGLKPVLADANIFRIIPLHPVNEL